MKYKSIFIDITLWRHIMHNFSTRVRRHTHIYKLARIWNPPGALYATWLWSVDLARKRREKERGDKGNESFRIWSLNGINFEMGGLRLRFDREREVKDESDRRERWDQAFFIFFIFFLKNSDPPPTTMCVYVRAHVYM